MSIFERYQARYESSREEDMSLQEYLDLCRADPMAYAGAAERLLAAIGEAELIDTHNDSRLSRIFQNKVIKRYPAFADFYGMEESIEQLVSYLKHAAQGLEERKQILYLLGPVGGGKSSLAEKLKELMEKVPFYAIKDSPVFESPLGLFAPDEDGPILEEDYGIPSRCLRTIMSPWAVKRLQEYNGDITKFRVVKLYPSILEQVAVAKTEPGDENNQDISSLVGKVDIRQLEHFAQNDADAYSYSGALCRANQGLMEFVEMFKAPIKVLHPLLTATQEGNYNATEGLSAIPFQGIILAHSNESEWQSFRNNKNNEAFLDRVFIVKVPYCLRVTEEKHIYDKLLRHSSLNHAPCAPGTLEMMAQFSVLTRLKEPENSSIFSKMRVYDGENLKDTDPKAKSTQEYRDYAGVDEGMSGISTRFAFKILSQVFNFDHTEVAANPVHLLYVLERQIVREHLPPEVQDRYVGFLKQYLAPPLRGVHRQGIADGLPGVLCRVRPEHLRPLRHLCGLLDSRPGIPRPGHRRDDAPRCAERGAGEDREARRHLEPEGLPQRDRQLRAARARQQQRCQPALDELREAPRRDREEDVLEHRGAAAGHLLQRQGLRRRQEEARAVRRSHGREGLYA
jgi:serine protein kinase